MGRLFPFNILSSMLNNKLTTIIWIVSFQDATVAQREKDAFIRRVAGQREWRGNAGDWRFKRGWRHQTWRVGAGAGLNKTKDIFKKPHANLLLGKIIKTIISKKQSCGSLSFFFINFKGTIQILWFLKKGKILSTWNSAKVKRSWLVLSHKLTSFSVVED